MSGRFRALVVTEATRGSFERSIVDRPMTDLPAGEILIRVLYSSLNYKDALSATGDKGVTKRYPHVPGIDAAGIVEESSTTAFAAGEEVIVTGYELGSNHDGGFAEYVRGPAAWVVRRPAGLTLRECMIYGTAGFTAGLSVHRLLHHGVDPDQGPVLVTGAGGGVGSLAVGILARAGFHVVASTGKKESTGLLVSLGAREVIGREAVTDPTGRALLSGRWAGAVDTIGGPTLDAILRGTKLFGAVAACGNVVSGDLHTSIYPFILRGVSLIGINSAFTPMPLRLQIWSELATSWKPERLEAIVTEVSLSALTPSIDRILQGGIQGRILVNTHAW